MSWRLPGALGLSINPALDGSFVDRSATGRRAADAPLLVRVQRGFIVDGDFLAGLDIAQSDEENVAVGDLHEGVGFT